MGFPAFATDSIASWLVPGAVSALVYGWLFMQVPETLIGTAIGVVLLPTISEQIACQQVDAFRQSLNRALRIILALTIPAAVLVMVGIRPLVGILGFDSAGTDLVVWVTRGFLIGLMGHALIEVASRSLNAQQNALIPLGASFLATITFISLAVSLGFSLGAAGIALANGLAFTGEALLLWYLLSRRFMGVANVRSTLVRIIPVALLGGVLAYGVLQLSLPISGIILGVLAEHALRNGKSEAGMDHYQVRLWQGWYHHMTMVMLAMLFMLEIRRENKEALPLLSCHDGVEILKAILPRANVTRDEIAAQIEERHRRRQSSIDPAYRRQARIQQYIEH